MPNKRSWVKRQWSAADNRWPLAVLCLLLAATLWGCGGRSEEVGFHRFEQLLFDTPPDRLQAELTAHRDEFHTDLIVLAPGDPAYIQMVQEFTADPVMRDIYRITDSLYRDLSDEERQLGRALSRAYSLCPAIPRVQSVYTMITGDYDNYNMRVYTLDGTQLCIALDVYALGRFERYQYFGLPLHVVRLCSREQIVPDCMRCVADRNIAWTEGDKTLLDYAVAEGKKLYFLEKCLPGIADTTLLRYTREQLEWMRGNERNVWGWLIQNKMLYSTDLTVLRNLIEDAPHTNAFGNNSAPRTAAYIGWQIVRAYMKKSGSSMQQLLDETDSQKILTASGWRP